MCALFSIQKFLRLSLQPVHNTLLNFRNTSEMIIVLLRAMPSEQMSQKYRTSIFLKFQSPILCLRGHQDNTIETA